MKQVIIPKRIDEPPHLLLWRMDDILPFMVSLIIGILTQKLMICLVCGVLVTKLYIKIRDDHPDGFFMHWITWHTGITLTKSRIIINPFIRRLFP